MIPTPADQRILGELCTAVTGLDRDKTLSWVNQALEQKMNPHTIIRDGLCKGIRIIGKKCETGEIFLPQLVEFSGVMEAAMTVLKSELPCDHGLPVTRVVLGVIQGDIHDIGKNILKSTLKSYGFRIIDLGKDVSPARFIETAAEENADIICISTYLDTTMSGMDEVLTGLRHSGLRRRIKVLIGGEAVSENFARNIGADGYAPNAAMAVDLVRSMVS